MFIGVECPLGAIPNAHTLSVANEGFNRKQQETHHYLESETSRQTCQLTYYFNNGTGYNITGAPVNIPDQDGVCFKYIYANTDKNQHAHPGKFG